MRSGVDENLWKDIILEAHRARRLGLDTINKQSDRVEWFNTLKQTANKNGYDSFIYKNEYEGAKELSKSASKGDSYMLLEPDQAKGLFGGMTEGNPAYMKNKGGLMLQSGGAVPMNNMSKQMELFEPVTRGFDEGGLMDEGGTVDPVSGNDVPPGSNQEEVRDDIPAQLSEGEFVFPADVVRFIGLEKLMMIRQRAKAGLQRMEDMGQMGNSEEAIMPDTLPFSIEDLDMEDDELEMAQGGVVNMANGGTYNVPDPSAGVYYNPASQPTTGVAAAPMKAASSNIARSIPIAQAATPVQAGSGKPTMFTDYELPQAPVPIMPQRDDLPAFLGEVTPGISGVDYVNEVYENEAGETETFRRYTDGRLLDENGAVAVIPEGYKIKSEAEKDVSTGPVKVETATVQDDGGSSNDNPENDGLGSGGARVGWGGTTKGAEKGLKVGSTMVGLGYTKVDPATGKPYSGLKGVPNALDFANVIGGLAFGDELPAGYDGTMTIDNVTTPIANQFFNEAKKNGYMGKSADLSLERARTNVQAANIMQAKYGLSTRTQAQAINDIAKEAARSDVGIAELAAEYGIDIETIKDNPFGFGKNYNDAVAKAVEAANTNRKGLRPDGKDTFDKGTDPFTADDIKAGHAARTAIDAHNAAVNAKAEAQRQADRDSGGDNAPGGG